MFFPGPGFIEDTPEVVKRLIAKWHNRQYAKQLEQEMRKLAAEFEDAKTQHDNEKDQRTWPTAGQRSRRNSTRSPAAVKAEKTIRPDQIGNDTSLKSLVKDLGRARRHVAVGELRRDLPTASPSACPAAGISEDESARLADEDPDRLARRRQARPNRRGGQPRMETVKLRSRSPGSRRAGAGRHGCRRHQYAEGVMALQIKDRTFVPLVQTGSEAIGTIPVGRLSQPMEDLEGRREGSAPSAPCTISRARTQPYVLAAHIQGTPGVAGATAPMNVVLVCRRRDGQRHLLRMAGAGQHSRPGNQLRFRQRDLRAQCLGLPGRRPALPGTPQAPAQAPHAGTLRRTHRGGPQGKRQGPQGEEQGARRQHQEGDPGGPGQAQGDRTARPKQQKLDATAIVQKIANESRNLNRKLEDQKTENHQKYNEEIRKINDAQEAKILGMQGTYKLWAVIIPPIPPLLVAAFVFFHRRAKEREGVSSKRLRV